MNTTNPIAASPKARRSVLARVLVTLFVLVSIAASSPVSVVLDAIASEIEARAQVENTYVVMAVVQLRNPSLPEEYADHFKSVQLLYSGRVSAMNELAAYLRAVSAGEGGGGGTPVIP